MQGNTHHMRDEARSTMSVEAFERALGQTLSPTSRRLLLDAMSHALSAHVDLHEECEPETFAFFLGERHARAEPHDLATWLAHVELPDLYLAFASSLGGELATRAFLHAHDADIRAVAAKFSRSGLSPDEAYQSLVTHLLVPRTTGDEPRILRYSGSGALKNWVRVAGTRRFIDMLRKQNKLGARTLSLDAEAIFDDPSAHGAKDDPELAFLKAKYRDEFRRAFQRATRELSSHQRNLLRQHHIAGLTLDRLAALHHVHRATIARHLAEARASLLSHTRAFMMQELALDSGEFESMMQLIASKLEVSFSRLLHSTHHQL